MREHRDSHLPFIAETGVEKGAEADVEAVGTAWLMIAERVPGPGQATRLCGDVQTVYVRPRWRGRAEPLYRRAGFEPGEHWLAWHLR